MRHPVLPFFPEKFFADAAHLTWEERGAYLILLSHAWVRGGSLPNDDRQLRLLVGCGIRKWRAMSEAVLSFWTLAEDGRWHQKRLDEEWQRANNHKSRASRKTREFALPRFELDGKKPNDPTRACPPDPTPTPIEEGEANASPPSRALTRAAPPVKNSGGRNGAAQKPTCADLVWQRIAANEADERERSAQSGGGHLRIVSQD